MRTANPALSANTFSTAPRLHDSAAVMTIQGTVNKAVLLLVITALAAMWTWNQFNAGNQQAVLPWLVVAGIGGFITALVTVWKKQWAAVTGPLYCGLQGIVLGAVSSIFEAAYPGIVIQAVGLTFGTAFSLLLAYRAGLIRATENFKLGVFAATGGIGLIYLASFLLGIFGIQIPYIHESGLVELGSASSSLSLPRSTSFWTSTLSRVEQPEVYHAIWIGTQRSVSW